MSNGPDTAHINLLRQLSCLSRSTINPITKTVEHKNEVRESGKLGKVEIFFCVVFSASRTDVLQPILTSNPLLYSVGHSTALPLFSLNWLKVICLLIMIFPYSGSKESSREACRRAILYETHKRIWTGKVLQHQTWARGNADQIGAREFGLPRS